MLLLRLVGSWDRRLALSRPLSLIHISCGATRYQVCPDYSAGSLHAYWKFFAGTALYDEWAHLEDPNVSWKAYQAAYSNLPSQPTCYNTDLKYHPCFGDGRGGEASEGSWYDYSLYRLRYAMNAIHTCLLYTSTSWTDPPGE